MFSDRWTAGKAVLEFLAPLIVSNCVISISEQLLNMGIVVAADRAMGATVLVAFGLANYIQKFVCSPLGPSKSLGVNIGGASSICFVCAVGLLCGVVLLLLGTLSVGSFIFGHDADVVRNAKLATICLAPLPMLWGLANVISGILLRRRRSLLVSASSVLETLMHLIVIGAVILSARYPQLQPVPPVPPMAVPLFATYAGVVTRLIVVAAGIGWTYIPLLVDEEKATESPRRYATFRQMAEFCWPLTVNELSGRSVRPLVNWVVSQAAETSELAALMVAYPIVSLGHHWLMETKQLPAAFAKDSRVTSHDVFISCVYSCLCSLAVMFVLAWTPVQTWLFVTIVGASPEVARLARPGLRILSLLPLPVAIRAFYYGWASFYKRTRSLAPAALTKTLTLLASLAIFAAWGVQGAILGSASLLCAFMAETATIVGFCMWSKLHTEWEHK